MNENKELKAKIKELQKVMDTELQSTDDQFLEKIKELEGEHKRKIEEMEAFSFLAAQEAEVGPPHAFPSSPPSSFCFPFS